MPSIGRFSFVHYKNGEVILPPELLEQLQNYVQGEILYIPKRDKKRTGWGEESGTKDMIRSRNEEIYGEYLLGTKTNELAIRYFLSDDSIRKIIRSMKALELTMQAEPMHMRKAL
jgi:Mor family transcriptional regulator